MAYENYIARLGTVGNTTQQRQQRIGKRTAKLFINSTINKTEVLINGVAPSVNVAIIKDRVNDLVDQRDLVAELESNIAIGDILTEVIGGTNWLIIAHVVHQIDDWFRGIMKVCNGTLKWRRDGIIYSSPMYYSNPVSNALRQAQTTGMLMTTNTDEISMLLPYRLNNRDFRISQRFFIGDEVYKIAQLNRNTNNIWYISFKKDSFNAGVDNFVEKIADYDAILDITDRVFVNASFKNIELTVGNTYPITTLLNINLTNSLNESIVKPYTVTSLNANATVSGSNITIVSHGEYSFKIQATDSINEFTTIQFKNVPTAASSITIAGQDKIELGDNADYSVTKIVASAPIVQPWTITIDKPTLATLQVLTPQSAKLIANENMKTGVLRITFTNDITAEVVFKDIKIESWWR